MRLSSVLAACAAATLALCAPAHAAAPANDNRAAAITLSAGADVTGTTVESTREANEPPNCPEKGSGSVWYRYTAPRDGSARVLLETKDKLDASIAVYEVDNSTINRIECADTRRGSAFVAANLDKGPYLIRVTERPGSGSGSFRLRFSGVLTEPEGTGTPLPASGQVRGTLNPLTRPFLRVSRSIKEGHDYRVRVAVGKGGECNTSIRVIAPGGDQSSLSCRDYAILTPGPGEGGRWTIALDSQGGAADEPYDVSLTATGPDDLAPGRFIGGFGRASGSVSGRSPDAEDVYRFDVTKRAEITLLLRSKGSMRMQLRTERGRRVTSAEVNDDTGQIRTRLRPGRFYVVVSAADAAGGRYTLSRLTRVITSTKVTWDGQSSLEKGPGSSSSVGVTTSAAASGRAIVTVERFDPTYGWRFWIRRTIPISGGHGGMSVPTTAIGRYRVRAEFLGTRRYSPSRTRHTASLRVVAPLRE
jgi:hypothetical protein